jgi:hypothetical protein
VIRCPIAHTDLEITGINFPRLKHLSSYYTLSFPGYSHIKYVQVCMYMCVCVYVCMYVCMYVCVHSSQVECQFYDGLTCLFTRMNRNYFFLSFFSVSFLLFSLSFSLSLLHEQSTNTDVSDRKRKSPCRQNDR